MTDLLSFRQVSSHVSNTHPPSERGLHRERVAPPPPSPPPLSLHSHCNRGLLGSSTPPSLAWAGGNKGKQFETLIDKSAHHCKVIMRVCVCVLIQRAWRIHCLARRTIGIPDSPCHSVISELTKEKKKKETILTVTWSQRPKCAAGRRPRMCAPIPMESRSILYGMKQRLHKDQNCVTSTCA